MEMIYISIAQVIIWGGLFAIFYVMLQNKKIETFKFKINQKVQIRDMKKYLYVVEKKHLFTNKYAIKLLNIKRLAIVSMIFYLVSFCVLYVYVKVIITSAILAVPFGLLPILVIKCYVAREKELILKEFPTYLINLKSQITNDNNIILAIKRTKTNPPLKKYTDKFIMSIQAGLNIYEAFENMKLEIDQTTPNMIQGLKGIFAIKPLISIGI